MTTTPTFQEPTTVAPKVVEPEADASAPFGRKANGQAYKRDPKIYENRRPRGSVSGTESGTAPAPRRRAASNTKSSSAPTTQERAEAIFNLISIPVAGLAMAGQMQDNVAFLADSIVVGATAPKLSLAVADIADQDPRVAALVDQLVQTGPFAALFAAVMPMVIQVAANHSQLVARLAAPLGAMTPEAVVEQALQAQAPSE